MKVCKHYWLICLAVILAFTSISIIGSHLFTAIAVYADNLAGPTTTIIIDAGHGGEDGGAVSCTGVMESQLNLQIAQRLDGLLNLLGYRTNMLRNKDIALYSPDVSSYSEKKVSDLKNRVRMINTVSDAVLISIHQNNFTQSQYRGAQVFYATTDESQVFAEMTQNNLRQALDPVNKREIKTANGIYIMEHITCPGILVECGFLSNPDEEALLRDETYQKKIAVVLATSIGTFLSKKQEI